MVRVTAPAAPSLEMGVDMARENAHPLSSRMIQICCLLVAVVVAVETEVVAVMAATVVMAAMVRVMVPAMAEPAPVMAPATALVPAMVQVQAPAPVPEHILRCINNGKQSRCPDQEA